MDGREEALVLRGIQKDQGQYKSDRERDRAERGQCVLIPR